MNVYKVEVDVIMSGNMTIAAKTEEEAIEQAKNSAPPHYDLRDFHWVGNNVTDIEEDEW